jgi:hypothetical protein
MHVISLAHFSKGRVLAIPKVGRLHHYYTRAA